MRLASIAIVTGLLTSAAGAQSVPSVTEAQVNVGVNVRVNFLIPVPLDEAETMKAREQARLRVYESAMRECDLLRQTVARECLIDQIAVDVEQQRSRRSEGGDMFRATGRFVYLITPK